MLIFISGGVRSGKSSFAERVAYQHHDGSGRICYIATSKAYDEEMIARVLKHQEDRAKSNYNWQTYEQSRDIAVLLPIFSTQDVVLVDCLTTLLGNELFFENRWHDRKQIAEIFNRLTSTINEYKHSTKVTIVVSNEIFSNGVPCDIGSLVYMEQLGKLHQYITDVADVAYLVEYGIPRLMKEGY